MSTSPFAFFRGSAGIMAADLASTPVTGLTVQCCGDAHLANFGVFASPERQLVFDINDFDETLAGPWEWDIKRLATSFTIAARHNGVKASDARNATEQVAKSYRHAMAGFSAMRTMDIWYAMLSEEQLTALADEAGLSDRVKKVTDKAKTRHHRQALDKLARETDGEYRIKSEPPNLIPLREIRAEADDRGKDLEAVTNSAFKDYRQSLPAHYRYLLERFRPVDIALKVVGVGSVGTLCMILLLEGRDREDPLFLQLKEAGQSVLAEYLSPGPQENQGQRVVEGQHRMQTVSDIFLGWCRGEKTGKDYYWRQLRDWKGSADVESLTPRRLSYLARLCGWTLARAHARTGDPVAIAGYLGSNGSFDHSMVEFASGYADQNERDFEAFVKEIRSGRLEAASG